MRRNNLKVLGLFIVPLLLLLFGLGFRWGQINKPSVYGGAGWKTDAGGERATLNSLSIFLKRERERNVIQVGYSIPEKDGLYLPQVKLGTRPYVEWCYLLEYNRRQKTLIKRPCPNAPNASLIGIQVWENVEENVIHQVAAPVHALKTTFAIESYKGGNLSELAKYGARLRQEPSRQAK